MRSTQARRRRSPFIVEQVWTVVEDIGVDAVKTGMLGDVATIEAVLEALDIVPDATRLRRSRHSGSSASALASRTPRTATTKPTSGCG